MSNPYEIKKLLRIHKRRWQKLEEQRASFGDLYIPVHILTQIEDEEKEIERLETELKNLLEAKLSSSDDTVRSAVAQELCALRDRSTVPVLENRLRVEADPTVRYWLAYALGRIGGEEAYIALKKAEARETDLFATQGIAEALQVISGNTESP